MPDPTFRFIDYNELTIKPNDLDVIAIYNVSGNELKKMSYNTIKGLFLKTDENNTGLTGNIQVNDNVKFIAGNSSDFKLYHDGTDTLLLNDLLNSETILRFKTGPSSTIDMLRLNPAGPTISIGATNIANLDNSTHGFNIDVSGNLQTKKKIECGGNIDLGAHFLSGDGGDYGLSMSTENATISGNANITGQINANKSGTYALNAAGAIRTNTGYYISGNAGITTARVIVESLRYNGSTLQMKTANASFQGGIIKAWGTAVWDDVPTL